MRGGREGGKVEEERAWLERDGVVSKDVVREEGDANEGRDSNGDVTARRSADRSNDGEVL